MTVSTVLTVGTIRIQSIFSNQIIFVFVFGRLFKTEKYLYSYSVDFSKPNNIRMRDPMNDVMMNPMSDRGKRIIRYSNIIRIVEAEYWYSYSYSGNFFKPNNIRIRIRSPFSNRIIFVFVFGHF